ncbi:MAG: NAD(P)/FAD-dependent oxidoreductase, partial [Sulfurovum sp.]|nr:NAD(P)/FAD-dependent oxidoreductase [Sulfurovum sp.]
KGAEVATGGIDTREVDPVTMASRLVPNLYFAGEILDVDGDRGGFNFHFAWVSGMRSVKQT